MNDVANLPVKRERHALRFEVSQAPFTLDQILVWWRYNDPGQSSSYSAGDGGTYEVSLQDVGADGAPNGDKRLAYTEVIDSTGRPNTIMSNYQRSRDVPRTTLEPGRYALVFDNIDPDPRANHASLNGPIWWNFGADDVDDAMADPGRPERAALKEYDDGGWDIAHPYGTPDPRAAFYMPVWAVRDSRSGISIGQEIHYGEAITSMTSIDSDTRVRQRIVPTGDLDDAVLHLLVGRVAGREPLVVRVDDGPPAAITGLPLVPDPEPALMHRRGQRHYRWVSLALPESTVRAGKEMIIELESPAGRHRICAGLRNRYYGPKDWDGRAELSEDGGPWSGWSAHGKPDSDDVQLCIFVSGR